MNAWAYAVTALAVFGLAGLVFWWLRRREGQAASAKGMELTFDAKERERLAWEEVARLRARGKPDALGLRHVEKPVRQPPDPPEGGAPPAGH